jgi:MoxR-like ATPase
MSARTAALIVAFAAGLTAREARSNDFSKGTQPYRVTVTLGATKGLVQPASVLPNAAIPKLTGTVLPQGAAAAPANEAVSGPERVQQIAAGAAELVSGAVQAAAAGGSDESVSRAGQSLADMRGGSAAVPAGDGGQTPPPQKPLSQRIAEEQPYIRKYYEQVRRVMVGQEKVVDLTLVSLIVHNGHMLIEGDPGLGKTHLIKAVSRVSGLTHVRIQFRSDMLPADIVGFKDEATGKVKWGPITRGQITQADEVNRGTPRAKSALLEPMQEGRATIDDETKELPQPNRVHATMNPIDTEGVFPMLEPEKDRFLISVSVPYPTREEEKRVAREQSKKDKVVPDRVLSAEHIERMQALAEEIGVSDEIEDYVQDVVRATRVASEEAGIEPSPYFDPKGNLAGGAGPRASIAMTQVARAYAFLAGREYVNADDVQKAAYPVLRHRMRFSPKGKVKKLTPEKIIAEILRNVPPPKPQG